MDKSKISDGDHTFQELYEHRSTLLCLLCNKLAQTEDICYKTTKHSDEENYPMPEGYFLVSIETPFGPITYHVQNKYWDMFQINIQDRADTFDGADSNECLERLQAWCNEI